ncbi:MAG: aspartate aminotransferase family protein [Pseudohongiellaceae bacterium]
MTSVLMSNYGNPELEFDHGKGCYLYTASGDRYLDFTMGIAVNSLGHCHPRLVTALQEQTEKLWHTSNLYRIGPAERLAKRLTELTFAERVFFCNSGTEAVEAGFKIMRRYHHHLGKPHRKRIIALSESFHGRTLAPLAASANPAHTEGFLVGDSGFDQVAFGDIDALAAAVNENTAGIILEPVQGEGGIRVMPGEYLKAVRQLCDDHGLLLMYDEVQCGIARSGSIYAHQQPGVEPDILASAKGLGGGFPVGACLTTEKASACMVAGSHGSTFGGNFLAMAAANAVLDEVTTTGFLENVRDSGSYLIDHLTQLAATHASVIGEVTGIGLMIGIKCIVDNNTLVRALQKNKMLVVRAGANSIRLLPPLNVERAEMDEALGMLAGTLDQLQET